MAAILAACGGSGRTANPATSPSIHADPLRAAASASAKPSNGRLATPAARSQSHVDAQPITAPQPLTSCRSVVHVGDSTSDGLVLPDYQPDARLRIAAQYRRVGVVRFIPEVSGARSIVETWHGFPNAQTVAHQLLRGGYHGCWVLALGTNDTADVAAGSTVSLATRVRQMMSLIGRQRVMWVNVISLLGSGPYAERRMQQWNNALVQACVQYPDMRVYDWAAAAERGWFIPDGIHYTPAGYAERSRLIANALAAAFPAVLPPPPSLSASDATELQYAIHDSCVVQ